MSLPSAVPVSPRAHLASSLLLASDLVALAASVPVATGSADIGGRLALAVFSSSILLWCASAALAGLYRGRLRSPDHSTLDEAGHVVQLLTVSIWLPLVAAVALGQTPQVESAAVYWAVAIPLVLTGRAVTRTFIKRNRLHWQRAVVVGAGEVGQLIGRKLVQHPEYGIEVVGFVDAQPRKLRPEVANVPVLGPVDELEDIVDNLGIDRVVFAFSRDDERLLASIRRLALRSVQIDVVPRLYEVIGATFDLAAVEGFPLLGLVRRSHPRYMLAIKRLIDIALSTALLAVIAPSLGLIALLIKLDSEGPVLFRQTRLGRNMRPFTMVKFRTMRVNTDETLHREYIRTVASSNAAPGADNLYKLDRSDTITGVGHWLRRLSLDELPQLFNVLRGDMSLVGPRPCIPYELEFFKAHHFERFALPAGITGLWQVASRARSTFGEALELDVTYVKNWSLWLDLRLLVRTAGCLTRSDITT